MTILLPDPMYVGNSALVGVTFTVPQVGLPRDQWPVGDPGEITLQWVGGDGASLITWMYQGAGSIVRQSEGIYTAVMANDNVGRWSILWTGTAPVAAVVGGSYPVSPLPAAF
jgi:hypothetical protein